MMSTKNKSKVNFNIPSGGSTKKKTQAHDKYSGGNRHTRSNFNRFPGGIAKKHTRADLDRVPDGTKKKTGEDNTPKKPLASTEAELDKFANDLKSESKYWQEKRNALQKDNSFYNYNFLISKPHHNFVFRFFQNVATYVESPGYYIKHLFADNNKEVECLEKDLEKLISDLSNPESTSDKTKIKLAICDSNLRLINLQQATINNVHREIDYCTKTVNAIELILTTLVFTVIRTKLAIPELHFGISDGYSRHLYAKIQNPIYKIKEALNKSFTWSDKSKEAMGEKATAPHVRKKEKKYVTQIWRLVSQHVRKKEKKHPKQVWRRVSHP